MPTLFLKKFIILAQIKGTRYLYSDRFRRNCPTGNRVAAIDASCSTTSMKSLKRNLCQTVSLWTRRIIRTFVTGNSCNDCNAINSLKLEEWAEIFKLIFISPLRLGVHLLALRMGKDFTNPCPTRADAVFELDNKLKNQIQRVFPRGSFCLNQ